MEGAEGEGVEVEVEEGAGKVFGKVECGWEIMTKEKKARERWAKGGGRNRAVG